MEVDHGSPLTSLGSSPSPSPSRSPTPLPRAPPPPPQLHTAPNPLHNSASASTTDGEDWDAVDALLTVAHSGTPGAEGGGWRGQGGGAGGPAELDQGEKRREGAREVAREDEWMEDMGENERMELDEDGTKVDKGEEEEKQNEKDSLKGPRGTSDQSEPSARYYKSATFRKERSQSRAQKVPTYPPTFYSAPSTSANAPGFPSFNSPTADRRRAPRPSQPVYRYALSAPNDRTAAFFLGRGGGVQKQIKGYSGVARLSIAFQRDSPLNPPAEVVILGTEREIGRALEAMQEIVGRNFHRFSLEEQRTLRSGPWVSFDESVAVDTQRLGDGIGYSREQHRAPRALATASPPPPPTSAPSAPKQMRTWGLPGGGYAPGGQREWVGSPSGDEGRAEVEPRWGHDEYFESSVGSDRSGERGWGSYARFEGGYQGWGGRRGGWRSGEGEAQPERQDETSKEETGRDGSPQGGSRSLVSSEQPKESAPASPRSTKAKENRIAGGYGLAETTSFQLDIPLPSILSFCPSSLARRFIEEMHNCTLTLIDVEGRPMLKLTLNRDENGELANLEDVLEDVTRLIRSRSSDWSYDLPGAATSFDETSRSPSLSRSASTAFSNPVSRSPSRSESPVAVDERLSARGDEGREGWSRLRSTAEEDGREGARGRRRGGRKGYEEETTRHSHRSHRSPSPLYDTRHHHSHRSPLPHRHHHRDDRSFSPAPRPHRRTHRSSELNLQNEDYDGRSGRREDGGYASTARRRGEYDEGRAVKEAWEGERWGREGGRGWRGVDEGA